MASFVANHRKKIRSLRRKEDELRRLIDREASEEHLLAAASEVREARIRVLRVKQYSDPEICVDRTKYHKIEDKINAILALSPEAVLGEYLPAKNDANSN